VLAGGSILARRLVPVMQPAGGCDGLRACGLVGLWAWIEISSLCSRELRIKSGRRRKTLWLRSLRGRTNFPGRGWAVSTTQSREPSPRFPGCWCLLTNRDPGRKVDGFGTPARVDSLFSLECRTFLCLCERGRYRGAKSAVVTFVWYGMVWCGAVLGRRHLAC
jgi:hypothetical protein